MKSSVPFLQEGHEAIVPDWKDDAHHKQNPQTTNCTPEIFLTWSCSIVLLVIATP